MTKKLYKSGNDRAISGVCAGIADYFDIDVIVVRLLAVIFCFISFGTALIAYIIAAIVIPEEPVVRMSDGTKRPVYETTYQYRGETGAGGSGASAGAGEAASGSDGEGWSAPAPEGTGSGSAEFYTGGMNGAAEGGSGIGSGQSQTGNQAGNQTGNQTGQPNFYEGAAPKKKSSGSWIVGILLVGMGVYMIVDWFFPWVSWRIFGAVILILLGLIVLIKR